MTATAFLFSMPSGIPGAISRQQFTAVEPQNLDSAKPFGSYGIPGYISGSKFVPVDSSLGNSSVYGFLVRAYPTQGANPSDPLSTAVPKTSGTIDIMRRGYMTVLLNAGTAVLDGQAYVRTANPSTGKPVGGIEATQEWGSSSASKSGGNTGNGTLVLDATSPVQPNAIAGAYTINCITASTNAATFRVSDPMGRVLGDVSFSGSGASATFNDQIKFAVTDGSTDFVVGDGFVVTVVANTLAIPRCRFQGAADATGNVELAFNI